MNEDRNAGTARVVVVIVNMTVMTSLFAEEKVELLAAFTFPPIMFGWILLQKVRFIVTGHAWPAPILVSHFMTVTFVHSVDVDHEDGASTLSSATAPLQLAPAENSTSPHPLMDGRISLFLPDPLLI